MGSAKYTELISTIRLDLLDLFGSRYVIDHCIAALNKSRKESAYRSYVTDALKNINEILARNFGGSYLSMRYDDMMDEGAKGNEPESGDEIVLSVFRNAGLRSKGGEPDGNAI